MMHAYPEVYLSSAMRNLGQAFDYAIRTAQIEGARFVEMFLRSSISQRLANGEPLYLVGRSGVEIAVDVIEEVSGETPCVDLTPSYDRSQAYWVGWAICYYQWHSGLPYQKIFRFVSYEELAGMYPVHHEMDVTRFADTMNALYRRRYYETNLKRLRTSYGCSQRELAEASGVSLRSIQMYEQGHKDINKGQARTLRCLARVLGCGIEDLMEPEFVVE